MLAILSKDPSESSMLMVDCTIGVIRTHPNKGIATRKVWRH